MNTRKSLLLSAIIAAFVFPIGSYAQEATKSRAEVKKELEAAHKDGTHEMGNDATTVKPPAAKVGKSRQQVKKELEAAHKDGTHEMGNDATTVKPPPAKADKSRQEVKKELANMTPEEKKKLKDSNLGAK